MSYPTLFFDTEFRDTSEYGVHPVSACVEADGVSHSYWLDDESDLDRFAADWNGWMRERRVIVCHAAEAETRTLLALGATPKVLLRYRWLDTHMLARMLATDVHSLYGQCFAKQRYMKPSGVMGYRTTNKIINTVPPPLDYVAPEFPEPEDEEHTKVGTGLADQLLSVLGVNIYPEDKEQMRDLILSGVYTDADKARILAYGAQDVAYLKPLANKLANRIKRLSAHETTIDDLINLSSYTVCMGIVERNGIPIEMERAERMGQNYSELREEIINHVNLIHPFYAKERTTKADLLRNPQLGATKWVFKVNAFQRWVRSGPYASGWPRTPKEAFKSDTATLKDMMADEVAGALFTAKDALKAIEFFSPARLAEMRSHLGSDGRLRLYLAPYASKTSRNQPGVAQGYVLGMPVWTRSLIGSPDTVVIGGDYASEEIALQALASGDENLMEAYQSGDPYFWLAQLTGTVDRDIVQDRPKHYLLNGQPLPDAEQKRLKGIRNTFKALFLGLGYGLGNAKLAARLTAARINSLSEDEKQILRSVSAGAEETDAYRDIMAGCKVYPLDEETDAMPPEIKASTYVTFHKNVFSRYWEWRDETKSAYQLADYLRLPDGWCMFGNEREMSAMNFPVQGLGAVILRRAIRLAIQSGLVVISPHHDAIYITSTPDQAEMDADTLTKVMNQAVLEICGSDCVGVDTTIESTDWKELTSTWSDERQPKEFKRFGFYMTKERK